MRYIYSILNTINYKIYIGQTTSPKNRWVSHKCEANSKRLHYPIHKAIKKYGIENFQFSIIEVCDYNDVDNLEKFWIKKFNSRDSNMGYNLALGGNVSSGWHHSEESKRKISESNMGKEMSPHTDEWKERMSEIMTGRVLTDEWKQKISDSNKGKIRSDETKLNISEAKKGTVISESTKQKMSKAKIGKKKSEEMKKKISGENHYFSKLNWEIIREIRREYSSGEFTYAKLAKKYNVDPSNIFYIVKNKSWKE